ncbi:unnamed protein product [Rotaria sordida]|uniref:Uncharacterized protein n=1 Tax=Rotaria sordida TaxID=392033 RepID=A0A814YTC1_9BILA|nr:unnamed protein product [Rotaria sordida]CAF1226534.1 unnamed protein product [Rotaria sordida]CAF1233725.1 unnamed protein product [Rotaria sordida]CAF1299077.1 unnamed protein product [Rotaria sordida]CAF4012748.1 unnamed protein product [Rotaria sordida]
MYPKSFHSVRLLFIVIFSACLKSFSLVYRARTNDNETLLGDDDVRILKLFEANDNPKPDERINSTTLISISANCVL